MNIIDEMGQPHPGLCRIVCPDPFLLPCCGDRAWYLRHSQLIRDFLPENIKNSILLLSFFRGSQTSLCCGERAWYLRHSLAILKFFLLRPWGVVVVGPWPPRGVICATLGAIWGPFGRPWPTLGRPWVTLGAVWGPLWSHLGGLALPRPPLGSPGAP